MSDLIEKVKAAIAGGGLVPPEVKARAAIAAVAEWLDDIGKHTAAAELRAGSIMEAAP